MSVELIGKKLDFLNICLNVYFTPKMLPSGTVYDTA